MSNLETTASLAIDQLPLEVLHAIFNYIDIPDIFRIRRVSRYLNEATNYRNVWVNAYRTSELVCPPGPFPFQTVHDLEKWYCANGKLMLKQRNIRYTDEDLDVRSLVFGRFLFVAFEEEVRYYDLNLDDSNCNSNPNTIYRTTGGILSSFYCVSATDIEGHPFACVVLDEAMQGTRRISIYLLNVGERSEVTLDLLHQFEHRAFLTDTVNLGPRVIVIQGIIPGDGFDSGRRLVALDVHARTLLPSFTHATWGAAEAMPERELIKKITAPKSISTSTHLVLAWSFYTEAAGWCTCFEAFALPTTHTHHYPTAVSTHLDPSHQGIIPGISVRVKGTLLLHDAVLDSSTQDVLIAIRVRTFRPRTSLSQHGILRLGTIHGDREVGTIAFQLLGPFLNRQIPLLRPCFNGTSRVFYTRNKDAHWIVGALEYNLHASSNEVDGEHGAKVVTHPCVLQFPTQRTLLDYDPYYGRICLRYTTANYTAIEILDLSA
ncbi:hypothetical protein JVT61DRAFT_4095 [Boletus reticuloceps]|uniref:F-box domain-containing protein n=1 Tax=Boletus reticuloceps TaxID=495285 RepID=A0A8I2YL60_9AGAM|nr:hypothetical protein JVT61DRAFT_4095 [Boletus reticuloceps]